MILLWILGFGLFGSFGAVMAAGSVLLVDEPVRQRLLPFLVSYATGTLLATALLGLLPEAIEQASVDAVLPTVLAGLVAFFVLERVLMWRHCHVIGHCARHHAAAPLIVIGDTLHNFVDGIVLAAAFLSSVPLGIATGLAIVAHEIPQEVGDFAVLLDGGMAPRRALLWNLLSGTASFAGAILAYVALPALTGWSPYVLAISASSFLYIGLADLVPELHGHTQMKVGVGAFLCLLAGVAVIVALRPGHP